MLRLKGLLWSLERNTEESKGISKDKEIYVVGEVLSPSFLTFSSVKRRTTSFAVYGRGICQAGLLDEVSARGYRTSGGPADTGESSECSKSEPPHLSS